MTCCHAGIHNNGPCEHEHRAALFSTSRLSSPVRLLNGNMKSSVRSMHTAAETRPPAERLGSVQYGRKAYAVHADLCSPVPRDLASSDDCRSSDLQVLDKAQNAHSCHVVPMLYSALAAM